MKIDAQIFKAYDIRGRYPGEINERVIAEIARKLPKLLGKKIVVAHDARLSSPTLYKAVLEGLQHSNILENVGMTTTPMFYFLVSKLKATGGIMVTASHNPKEFNGLKVVGKNAKPISGQEVLKIVS